MEVDDSTDKPGINEKESIAINVEFSDTSRHFNHCYVYSYQDTSFGKWGWNLQDQDQIIGTVDEEEMFDTAAEALQAAVAQAEKVEACYAQFPAQLSQLHKYVEAMNQYKPGKLKLEPMPGGQAWRLYFDKEGTPHVGSIMFNGIDGWTCCPQWVQILLEGAEIPARSLY